MTPSLLIRYKDKIAGVLSCYDRVVLYGTLPGLCYAVGMAEYLSAQGIRLFDYPRWAEPLREAIRHNAESVAREQGVELEFVRRAKAVRKEELIAKVLARRGDHPGLVHILSAMEPCQTYKPWHDKKTGRTSLRPDSGKCLHYYFYFIDDKLGLCYLRVPTWAPFRLQFYYNGHNELAAKLRRHGISFTQRDNAFVAIEDFTVAQQLADQTRVEALHRALDSFALKYCPVLASLGVSYHWSIMQCEYSTDIVFHRQDELQPIYETLVRTAIHAVKPEHVATFLGRKLDERYRDELGNDFSTRITYCHNAPLGRRDFYRQLCRALALPDASTAGALVHTLASHVQDLRTERLHPVLLLDESHLLPQETLDVLHLLMNYDWDSLPLLSLVLIGLPELHERLALRRNRSLYSRLTRRLRIEPLAPEDTAQYLRTRLRRAGCERDLFTPAAVIALHEAVGGAMRELDRLAQAALREAARHKRRLVDVEHVQTLLHASG